MHRIGILTSGGDAPGMNSAIRGVIRAAVAEDFQIFAIFDGYKGLIEDKIEEVHRYFGSEIINRGGTKLRTARLPSFKDEDVRKQAVEVLKKHNIDSLICIGGDGTYKGALGLANLGVKCICIPATIDNDIASTDTTIGFMTALNTITEAIDKLRDTSSSHERCSIIEVMGRNCGDLALNAGISSGAEIIISSERILTDDEIIANLIDNIQKGKLHEIVVVSEKITDVHALAKRIECATGVETRATVLGYVQRGGTPCSSDRILASRMGVYAVDAIRKGLESSAIGLIDGKLVYIPLDKALSMTKKCDFSAYRDAELLR